MRRFKNILAVYDLVPGCDETLQKAVDLASRNRARLTVVQAINPVANPRETIAERERLMQRIMEGIFLPDSQKAGVVRQGPPAECILEIANRIGADLVITPEHNKGFAAQVLGFDISAELLRHANCPTWVVRKQSEANFKCIVAALNAGKADALDCQANRRILEIGSSLAVIEQAELHLVYAWDYEGRERDMMASELPRGKRNDLSTQARLRSLERIVELTEHVLGDFSDYKAMPIRGRPRGAIANYVKEQDADLLIIDGQVDNPIKAAFIENTTTHLLRQSSCSVLCTRPAPAPGVPVLDSACAATDFPRDSGKRPIPSAAGPTP
jgi:nucleotide-binding universal stress UspA family protein